MLVSVTTLGASAGNLQRAADQIVGYLEGTPRPGSDSVEPRLSQKGSAAPDTAPLTQALNGSGRPGGYFADSAESPGRWRGQGTDPEHFDLGTRVDPQEFRRVLLGQDPWTGEQLLQANGSSGRRRGKSNQPSTVEHPSDELLDLKQVADIAGIDVSYIRRLAKDTSQLRHDQRHADAQGIPRPETPRTYFDAHKNTKGRWVTQRSEAERFANSRKEPKVILGYDITWSVPKSVSAIYAQGTDHDQAAIEESIEASINAGMGYLEREGFHVRRNGNQEKASNLVAASYRHYTNRNLEPQLHEHVIIANMATNSLGETRAVDARGLFAHGTTAGYLAGAELRHQLTERIGVSWTEPHKGLADIKGIDRSTIMAISTRRQEVLSLSNELGYFTPESRQRAAVATRPGKEQSVDGNELRARWRELLSDAGLTPDHVQQLHNTNSRDPWTPTNTTKLFDHLASHRGVTEQAAIFDRRDVIQAVANFTNDQATAADIEDLADHWLSTPAAIPLHVNDNNRREAITNTEASLAPNERRYTTPHMLRIEERVLDLHEAGRNRSFATVPATKVEQAINSTSHELGADQAAMVRAITTSGHQFQAVVGRAGAGKTTAIRAAVTAWESSGYRVIGAAPFGDAARKLEQESGLRSNTLEGLLTRIETAGDPASIISANTVIVVDEASTIGNRQLDRLYRHATQTGASVRTIGDPQQHQSVEAGGLWKHITTQFATDTPTLDHNRRQTGSGMAQVRLAVDEYRQGLIGQALQRLDNDTRIVTAPTWEELLDQMATDWLVDHRRHTNGHAAPSKMVAERNHDRHALNQRAQALLRSERLLPKPVTIGESDFHIGDRIVAQTRNTELRAEGASRRDHIINGSEGTVLSITGTTNEPSLQVDFDGLGTITVPHKFIATEVGPGRGGGVTPSYAVTSFKAEGQTFDTGRNLAAPGAVNTEGMYVALTRGRNDQRTYTIAPAQQHTEPPELPIIADERSALEALADSLSKPRGEDLATLADPDAAKLAGNAKGSLQALAGRAQTLAEQRITAEAINNPDLVTVAALGERPPVGHHRHTWDSAVGEAALYRARWDVGLVTLDGGVPEPAPGNGIDRHDHYGQVQAAVLSADVEHLAQVPLSDLVAEHTSLLATRPTSSTHDHQATVQGVERAKTALNQAQVRLRSAEKAGNTRSRVRPRTALDTELSRRAVLEAKSGVACATADLARSQQRLRASNGDPASRAAINARTATIDRALSRRVTKAVSRPTDYLVGVLGDRPRQHTERERWNEAATTIESYRHRHIHVSPAGGKQGSAGLAKAIGPRPTIPGQAKAWDQVNQAIERHLSNSRAHEQPLRRRR